MILLLTWLASADPVMDARELVAEGRVGSAEKVAREWLASAPEDPARWVLLAEIVSVDMDPAALIDEALRLDPTYAPAWTLSGNASFAAGDHGSATLAWERAVAMEPADVAAWRGLITALPGDSIVAQRALKALPGEPLAWLATGRVDEAIARFPSNVDVRRAAADHHLASGNPMAALVILNDLPGVPTLVTESVTCAANGSLSTSDAQSLPSMALTTGRRRALVGANLDGLTSTSADCPAVWMARSLFRSAVGDREAAATDLERAGTTPTPSLGVQRAVALARVRRGDQRGILTLGRIWTVTHEPFVGISLAQALFAAQKADQGRAVLAHAMALYPLDPDVALAYVDRLGVDGHELQARDVLEALLVERPRHAGVVARARASSERTGRAWLTADQLADITADLSVDNLAPDPLSDMTIIIQDDALTARKALEDRLSQLGYALGNDNGSVATYRSEVPLSPWVKVYADGRVEVQSSGVVRPPEDSNLPGSMIGVISRRKMKFRYERVLRATHAEAHALQEALATRQTMTRIGAELADQLQLLWDNGTSLTGSEVLMTPAARRMALVDY